MICNRFGIELIFLEFFMVFKSSGKKILCNVVGKFFLGRIIVIMGLFGVGKMIFLNGLVGKLINIWIIG